MISLVAASALAASTLAISTAADARPGYRNGHQAYYGGRRRGGGGARNAAAAAAAVGIAGAVIGGAIAASQRPRYDYYDGPRAYGPGYGGYGYYD